MARPQAQPHPLQAVSADRSDPDSKTATSAIRTFLVGDIRQYTRFTLEHGDEAAADLADRFASITEDVVTSRAGRVVELRGDEALAVFTSPRQAIRAALALQEQFAAETECRPDRPLEVGIGIHAGEAVPVRGGYRGTALNLASRLCAQAGPGDVLVSETIVALAGRIEGVEYSQRAPASLKGFDQPIGIVAVSPERCHLRPRSVPPSTHTPLWLEDRPTAGVIRERLEQELVQAGPSNRVMREAV
jgi:class 3 adenylate cyclase